MKAYLRYELAATWGVISSNSNVVFDRNWTYLITASLENVSLWSLKQAVLVGGLSGILRCRAGLGLAMPSAPRRRGWHACSGGERGPHAGAVSPR